MHGELLPKRCHVGIGKAVLYARAFGLKCRGLARPRDRQLHQWGTLCRLVRVPVPVRNRFQERAIFALPDNPTWDAPKAVTPDLVPHLGERDAFAAVIELIEDVIRKRAVEVAAVSRSRYGDEEA